MSKQRTKLVAAVLAICVGLSVSARNGDARPNGGGGGTGGSCWGCDVPWVQTGNVVSYCATGYLFGSTDCRNVWHGPLMVCETSGSRCAGTIVVGFAPAIL